MNELSSVFFTNNLRCNTLSSRQLRMALNENRQKINTERMSKYSILFERKRIHSFDRLKTCPAKPNVFPSVAAHLCVVTICSVQHERIACVCSRFVRRPCVSYPATLLTILSDMRLCSADHSDNESNTLEWNSCAILVLVYRRTFIFDKFLHFGEVFFMR